MDKEANGEIYSTQQPQLCKTLSSVVSILRRKIGLIEDSLEKDASEYDLNVLGRLDVLQAPQSSGRVIISARDGSAISLVYTLRNIGGIFYYLD